MLRASNQLFRSFVLFALHFLRFLRTELHELPRRGLRVGFIDRPQSHSGDAPRWHNRADAHVPRRSRPQHGIAIQQQPHESDQ